MLRNNIHNVATDAEAFKVLFFLIKFKTMGLMDEPDLATKLCAKALSSNRRKLFSKSLVVKKLFGQERATRSFFPAQGVNFHFFHKRRKVNEKASVCY